MKVLLDPSLTLEAVVVSVARGAFYQLHLVCQLWPFLDRNTLAMSIHAFVASKVDHCNVLYMGLHLDLV